MTAPYCAGNCNQGRTCTCETELANDLGPDPDRCIQPPARTPEDDAFRARVLRWAVVVSLASWGVLAALLELFGAAPFRR